MRIREIDIEAFGALKNLRLGPVGSGLTVFLGANEAGKSTILAFIRTMFFGFPDRRKRQKSFEPAVPCTYGGKIRLQSDSGKIITVERKRYFDGKKGRPAVTRILRDEGELLSESLLQTLLGSINRTLYENVFGFSLDELQGLESLESTEIKDAIYGAGFGTALLAVPKARKKLEQELKALFTPSGKKQEINRLLREIEEVRSRLAAAKRDIEHYQALNQAISEADTGISEIEIAIKETEKELQKLRLIRSSWDEYLGLCALREKVKSTGKSLGERLPSRQDLWQANQLSKRARAIEKELSEKKAELEALQLKMDENRADHRVLEKKRQIQGILAKRAHFASLEKEMEKRRQELQDLGQQVLSGLKALGEGWSEERLLEINIGFGERGTLSRFEEQFQRIDQEVTLLKKEQRLREGDLEELKGERERTASEVAKLEEGLLVKDERELKQLKDVTERLQMLVSRLKRLGEKKRDLLRLISLKAEALNIDNKAEDILSIDLDGFYKKAVAIQDEFTDVVRGIELLSRQYSHAQNGLRQLDEAISRRKKAILRLDEELGPIEESVFEISSIVKALSGSLPVRAQLESSLSSLGVEKKRLQKESRRLFKATVRIKRLKYVGYICYLTGLLGVLFYLFSSSNPEIRDGAGVLGTLFLLSGPLFQVYASRKERQLNEERKEKERSLEELVMREKSLDGELKKMQEDVKRLSLLLNVDEGEIQGSFNKVIKKSDYYLSRWEEKSALTNEIERLVQDRKEKEQEVLRIKGEIGAQEKRRQELKEGWERLKAEKGVEAGPDIGELSSSMKDLLELCTKALELREVISKEAETEDAIEVEMDKVASAISLTTDDSQKDYEKSLLRVKKRLHQEEERLDELRLKKNRLEEIDEAIRQCVRKKERIDEALEGVLVERRRQEDKWKAFLRDMGLHEYDSQGIKAISELFSRIEGLRGLLEKRDAVREEIRRLFGEISQGQGLLEGLLQDIGEQEGELDSLVSAVDLLSRRLDEELKKDVRFRSLNQKALLLKEQMEKLKGELQKKESELDAIFERFSVSSLEGLEEKCQQAEGFLNLKEEFNRSLLELSSRFGLPKKMEGLLGLFSRWSLHELDASINELTRKEQELLQRRDSLYKERAEAKEALKRLKDSREHQELLQKYETLLAKIKGLSSRWAVLSISRELLERARERFEQENQPGVLAEASRHFKEITGGKYVKILPDPQEGFVVLDREGRRMGPQRLSRGTAEQLYLCLRFGVISTCEPKGERIPVLMDDIFVNFDPERMKLAARAVAELASSRQVLFFTCHPHIASLLKSEGQDVELKVMNG